MFFSVVFGKDLVDSLKTLRNQKQMSKFNIFSIETNAKDTCHIHMNYRNCLEITFILLKNLENWSKNEISNQFLSKLILQKFRNF